MSPRLLDACARAVANARGERVDLADLVAVWERVALDAQRRADAIRARVARRSCNCADGGVGKGRRCGRCHGRRVQ